MAELTTEQFEAAKARGEARLRGPRVESAHYNAGRGRVIVRLTTGVEIGFAPQDAEGLQHAKRDEPAVIEVDAFGLGIHFPQLDADFYVPALLEGVLGSKSWMAARSDAASRRAEGVPGSTERSSPSMKRIKRNSPTEEAAIQCGIAADPNAAEWTAEDFAEVHHASDVLPAEVLALRTPQRIRNQAGEK